jgi:hypothetical protein
MKQLSFARRVVSSFTVSATASHVAQIHYDTAATIDFDFETHYTTAALHTAIDATTREVNGASGIHLAVTKLGKKLLSIDAGWRAGAFSTVVILVTDGPAPSTKLYDAAIRSLNSLGLPNNVVRLAIGVNNGWPFLNATQLAMFAENKPANVFTASSFTELDSASFVQKLLLQA